MSNILFLVSEYSGIANASGICTRNIVNQLKSKGHQVYVLCYDNGTYEENVYTIPVRKNVNRRSPLRKLFDIGRSFFVPVLDNKITQSFRESALTICKEKEIDIVVCVYFPLETVTVMKSIKEKYPNTITIAYELDSVGDGIFAASKAHYFATLAYESWSRRNYRYADKIIIMRSHERYWISTFGKKYRRKLLIADVPVLTPNKLVNNKSSQGTSIKFLYGGLLGKRYRSPSHLLSVIEHCAKFENVELDLYTKGDCEELIASFCEKNAFVRQHGYVTENILLNAIDSADILVSIGNRVSNSVPSKLITYLSYGKPVIHFSSQKDDVCAYYIKKYPLGIVIEEWASVETNAKKILEFAKKTVGKSVDTFEMECIFQMNCPEYSANIITNSDDNI